MTTDAATPKATKPPAGSKGSTPDSTLDLIDQVDRLTGARVVVVGDIMLDRFVHGQVDRISPEAPIPVLRVGREISMLGGAGNVVRNLVALGAEVCFVSVVGRDDAGRELTHLIGQEPGVEPYLLQEGERQTTVKVRYVAGGQQLLRADRETVAPVGEATADQLVGIVRDALESAGALVLSDYGKGVLTEGVLGTLIDAANAADRPVLVDPKGRDFARYRGAFLVTPNRRELAEAAAMPAETDGEVETAADTLMARHSIGRMLVTRSERGMSLVRPEGAVHLPAEAREVFDVSGAGDTVMATLSAGLAAGIPVGTTARLANAAAGIVVGKVGTAVVRPRELMDALARDTDHGLGGKTATAARALEIVERWRRRGLTVGFTNGCFDLIHPGHISLMAQAKAACDRLVVGLNSDDSVRRLKGESRPIQSEAARAAVLAALASVDLVVPFEDDTPLELIRLLRPDVLVKGADYTLDTVVGADVVRAHGGRVLLAELTAGHSTTDMATRAAGGAGKT